MSEAACVTSQASTAASTVGNTSSGNISSLFDSEVLDDSQHGSWSSKDNPGAGDEIPEACILELPQGGYSIPMEMRSAFIGMGALDDISSDLDDVGGQLPEGFNKLPDEMSRAFVGEEAFGETLLLDGDLKLPEHMREAFIGEGHQCRRNWAAAQNAPLSFRVRGHRQTRMGAALARLVRGFDLRRPLFDGDSRPKVDTH